MQFTGVYGCGLIPLSCSYRRRKTQAISLFDICTKTLLLFLAYVN